MVPGQHQDGGEKGNIEGKMHPALPHGLAAAAPCFPTQSWDLVFFFNPFSLAVKVEAVSQVVLSVKLLAWGVFLQSSELVKSHRK